MNPNPNRKVYENSPNGDQMMKSNHPKKQMINKAKLDTWVKNPGTGKPNIVI